VTKTRKVGQAGSFGPRYGTVSRRRYAEIVGGLRRYSECPQCHVMAVRRESVGVWYCKKCGYRFTGGAFTPQTKVGEVARRATKGTAPSAIATELGLVQAPKPPEEGKEPEKKRARRRRKTAEPSKEEQK
jgi:large subunit ribosomal protein L37Ae